MLTDITPDTNKPRSLFDLIFVKNPNYIPDVTTIFISQEKILTFGELSLLICTCAYNLKERFGIQKGDIVAICTGPHIDCVGGSIALVTNFSVDKPDAIAHDLEIVTPTLSITDNKGNNISLASAAKVGIPTSHILATGDTGIKSVKNVKDIIFIGEKLAEPCIYTPEEHDTLSTFIMYTSGSTGRKKAVIYTTRMMLSSLNSNDSFLVQKKKVLNYHQFHLLTIGFFESYTLVFYGNKIYIEQLKTNEEICQAIEQYKIARLSGAPYILTRMFVEGRSYKEI